MLSAGSIRTGRRKTRKYILTTGILSEPERRYSYDKHNKAHKNSRESDARRSAGGGFDFLATVTIPRSHGSVELRSRVPVAIAAMAMGLPGGMIIGGAFGLISFLQCFGICGSSALGAALVSVSPVLMFIQRFVSFSGGWLVGVGG